MPRASAAAVTEQAKLVLAILHYHPGGLGREAIAQEYERRSGTSINYRTLLRRLEGLTEEGRVSPSGRGRSRIYNLAEQQPSAPPTPPPTPPPADARARGTEATAEGRAQPEDDVPLSKGGSEVQRLIRQPIANRPPVSYQEEFLHEYEPGTTWYLTEAMRRQLHDRGRTPGADRPAGTFAHEIFERLLIDLAWASSRLEGNTYSRLDTKNLLDYGVRAEGKDATDAQMILNHKQAIELLVDQAEEIGFNRYTLSNLHAALSENLLDDPADEGRVPRTRVVHITGTTYEPIGIPHRIAELFDLFLQNAGAITDPFEQAFFVMVHIPYLQPFIDVNKRTSRLAANIPLIKANLCPLSFVGVPERAYVEGTLGVYEYTRIDLLRDVFLFAYERSCAQYRAVREAMGQPDPIRLRYRPQIATLVRETVLAGKAPRIGELRIWAESRADPAVAPEDRDRFAEIALDVLVNLHDGSIARYDLWPSEFEAWKAQITPVT